MSEQVIWAPRFYRDVVKCLIGTEELQRTLKDNEMKNFSEPYTTMNYKTIEQRTLLHFTTI